MSASATTRPSAHSERSIRHNPARSAPCARCQSIGQSPIAPRARWASPGIRSIVDDDAASRKVWKSRRERSEKLVKEDSVFRYESDVVQAAIRTGPNRRGVSPPPPQGGGNVSLQREWDARGFRVFELTVFCRGFSMGVGECSCTETGVSD